MLTLQFAVTSEAAYADQPEGARKCLEDSQGVCVDDKIHWTVELGASSCRLVSAGYLLAIVTVDVMVWLMVPLVPVIVRVVVEPLAITTDVGLTVSWKSGAWIMIVFDATGVVWYGLS